MKKKVIIIGVLLVLVLAGGTAYIYRDKIFKKKVPTLAQITNKPLPSKEAQQIVKKLAAQPLKNVNGDLTVYEDSNFRIIYAPHPDAYFIFFKSNDLENYSKYNLQAQQWFEKQGFSKEDMCKLILYYGTDMQLNLLHPPTQLPVCKA